MQLTRQILIFSLIVLALIELRAARPQSASNDGANGGAVQQDETPDAAAETDTAQPVDPEVAEEIDQDLRRLEIIERLRARDPGTRREERPKWREKPLPKPADYHTPIAYVNGALLPYAEVFEQFQQRLKDRPADQSQIPDEDWYHFKNREMLAYTLNWIQDQLLVQHARKQGLQVTRAEVQKQLELLTELSMLQESLDDVLRKRGVSRLTLEQQLEQGLLIDKLLRQGVAQRYTEQQLREYHRQYKEELAQPAAIYVATLFKSFYTADERRMSDAEIAALRAEIESLRARAVSVREFLALAREHSDNPYAGERCLLGWISDTPVDVIEKAVKTRLAGGAATELQAQVRELLELREFYFQQPAGVVSPVFESFAGLHLALILERRPAVGETFESVRGTIESRLMDVYKSELTQELRKQARISIDFNGLTPEVIAALRNSQSGR